MRAFRWFNLAKFTLVLVLAGFAVAESRADQIQMQNGDRYVGNVVSLNSDTLVLRSEVLGTLRLPRSKIALITFGATPTASLPVLPATSNVMARAATSAPPTNQPSALSTQLSQLSTNSGLLQQIEKHYLSDAGPEAQGKFNELMGGLMSGKLGVQDIRAQAQATAAQVRAVRKDLGEDAGGMLDVYLAILDRFVKESGPAAGEVAPKTSSLPSTSKPAREPDPEKE